MSYKRVGTYTSLPQTVRGQAVHLGSDPKGANILYTNGRAVIIRNLDNPDIATEYTGHSCQATVARYAPSGFYIASGDVQGNVRIWDTTQAENILKTETKVFSGKINDIAWDHESKRIIAVGEGKDRFGHAFLFDTASSVGEISGHSKAVNAVSIRQNRPFRAVTCSDDYTVNFYHGVPYKFNKSITDHSRFVQCVRFSPSGDHFVSAGMDQKIFLYDGKTGDKVSELTTAENTHSGGIFSLSWSPDGQRLMSASADATVKVWDVSAQKVVNTFTFSDTVKVEDQQVGSLWQGNHLVSLSLSGYLNYLDPTSGQVRRVVKGHQKAITALSIQPQEKTLYSGSYDGRVFAWNDGHGGGISVQGSGHTNQVTGIAMEGDKVYTVGMDDSLRSLNHSTKTYDATVLSTGSVPKSVAVKDQVNIIVTNNKEIVIAKEGTKVGGLSASYEPTFAAVSPQHQVVVGAEDGKIYVYQLSGNNLVPAAKPLLEGNRGSITCLSYSPDGSLLAAADANRAILVYDVATGEVKLNQWVFHTARVNSIAWSPDGLHAASGSLDTNIEVWSVEKPMKHISIKGAHLESVNSVVWLDNETIASAGQDAIIKTWSLVHY